jgi:hypothetical protein
VALPSAPQRDLEGVGQAGARIPRVPTWVGLVALGCYLAHAVEVILWFPWVNLCWSCNVAALLIPVALLLQKPAVNAIGGLILLLGTPFWIINISTGGTLLLTSSLSHVGGLALSLVGMRLMGVPRQTWWRAVLVIALLTLVSRWLPNPEENVNLAFTVPSGYRTRFPSHGSYLFLLGLLLAGAALGLQMLLVRIRFVRSAEPVAKPSAKLTQ